MNIVNTPKPFKGSATLSRAEPLLSFAYSPGPLGAEQVEIAVNYCGVCPADMSMIKDAWGFSAFPLVPGHDVVAVGSEALWRRYSTSVSCTVSRRSPRCSHSQVNDAPGHLRSGKARYSILLKNDIYSFCPRETS
jgi:hypothetical protein